jgi:Holliday junction resolvase RusA-like endonuclease
MNLEGFMSKYPTRAFEFEGDPIAWKRPGRVGNRYFDKQIKEKEKLREVVRIAKEAICSPNNALSLFFQFNIATPPSWSKKRALNAFSKLHKSKPDVDNLVKFLLDAFTGYLWEDDCQIAEIYASKTYAEKPSTKLVIVEVEE